jgi:hypothetical protein
MGPEEMSQCADLIDHVLCSVKPLTERDYELDGREKLSVREDVHRLCRRFPIPFYPVARQEKTIAAPRASYEPMDSFKEI